MTASPRSRAGTDAAIDVTDHCDGPCLVAGIGHDTCRTVAYPPRCADGAR